MHLALRQGVLRMAGKARVIDLLDFRMRLQEGGDGGRVLAMALHPHRQGFQGPQDQEAVERAGHRANRVLQIAKAFAQTVAAIADHRDPADHIGMAIEVFGRRMHDDVDAVVEGALHRRRTKSVVAHGDQAMGLGESGDGAEIDHFEERVGRAFNPDHFGFRCQGGFQIGRIGKIDETEFKPGRAPPDILEQAIAAAIKIVHGDHMVAAVEQLQDRAHRRQAGGEGEAGGAIFQIGDAVFQRETCRVVAA